MTQPHIDLLIAGGGIGGLATALAVARTGRRVHLVERAEAFGEIGAGLQIGPNATRALDELGLLDGVLDTAVKPRRGIIFDAVTGEKLTTLDFGEKFLERYGHPYIVTHRRDLLDVLLKACQEEENITLSNGRELVAVQEDDDKVTVEFKDGDVWTCDLIIGADGLKSKVRTLIDETQPVFHGHVAFRGTVPTEQVADFISSEDVALWIGPGLHLMQYPVRGGTLYNQVAVIESPRYAAGRSDWGTSEELHEVFAQTCGPVRRSVDMIEAERGTPVSDREPSDTWSSKRAVLIGDAAHAMLQYLGQGACQALEDALSLAGHLDQAEEDLPLTAIKGYEQDRIERASRCQRVARPWGALWHTRDETTLALRNRYFKQRADDDYTELDWLYSPSINATPNAEGKKYETGQLHHV
ncbi:FAD-dependent monooxygenase [Paenarthrobacter ureafaciens]|uniref:FAD-dependent monooxygenase n=1 Tax=Paenarthrobacter ureafaciens TaxID=37931 RepID=UPI002DB75DCB|nr:FAD-dependent monooxygenase [Paenarthrobacter ureafaciens]MEC3853909.1 FAD-dependent monooxygenase [Paenarthrobacter ureafaciens]